MAIRPPAPELLAGGHAAGVPPPGTDRRVFGRRGMLGPQTPTVDRAAVGECAAVVPTGANRFVLAVRRVCLSVVITSPADDFLSRVQGAGVLPAGADRCEVPRRRSCLPGWPV